MLILLTHLSPHQVGSHWGGAIEIAVCARLHGVVVHVYERSGSGGFFERIAAFTGNDGSALSSSSKASKTVSVVYSGRCHYDALQVAK